MDDAPEVFVCNDKACFFASLEQQLRIYDAYTRSDSTDTPYLDVLDAVVDRGYWEKGPYNKLRERYIHNLDLRKTYLRPLLFEDEGPSEKSLNEIVQALKSEAAVFVLSLGSTFEDVKTKIYQSLDAIFNSYDESDSESYEHQHERLVAEVISLRCSTFSQCVSEIAARYKYYHTFKQFERVLYGFVDTMTLQDIKLVILCDVDVVERDVDYAQLKLLTYFYIDYKALICLIFHNELLFARIVYKYRMVLPIHASALCNLNRAGPCFVKHMEKVMKADSAETTLPQLYRNILAHKTKSSPSYLIITALLELQQDKLISESNASLYNDVLSSRTHAVTYEQIKLRVREYLKQQRRVLTGIDALIQQEVARLNNEERSLAAKADVRLIEVCSNGSVFVPMKYSEIGAVLCGDASDDETQQPQG